MLQALRDHFPKWLVILTLTLFAGLLAFLGLYNFRKDPKSSGNGVVARVGKQVIRVIDLETNYERLKQQQAIQLGSDFKMTPQLEKQLRTKSLEQLILTEVLNQQACSRGHIIEEADIVVALKQIPLFQIKGQFSRPHFQSIIAASGHTESSFLMDLKKSMLIHQIRAGILQSAFILASEVDFMIRLVHQQRDFKYLIVPAAPFRVSQLVWQPVRKASRYSTQAAPASLMAAVFSMPYPQSNKMSIRGIHLPNGDYGVIALLTVRDGQATQMKATQRAIYQEELATELGQFDYALYTREALRRAKVNYAEMPYKVPLI